MHWYKVDVYINGQLSTSEGFNSWDAMNNHADKMEKEHPKAVVQTWVRER